jgi:hypothetical protein
MMNLWIARAMQVRKMSYDLTTLITMTGLLRKKIEEIHRKT